VDIRHLQTLRAVVDAGSFTGAAESLYVTQSAVSVQIRQLEDAVGATLFTRMPSGVRATHAGEVLYRYAGRILAVADEAQRELGALEEGRSQPIRIATNDVCAFLVSGVLARFAPHHPQTDVAVFEGPAEVVLSRLERGESDLAVVATTATAPDDQRRRLTLLQPEVVALAPLGHAAAEASCMSVAELVMHPLALYESGSLIRNIVDSACASAALRPRIVLESNSLGSLVRAVESGIGLTVVPNLAVSDEVEQGRVVSVGLPELQDRVSIELVTMLDAPRLSVQAFLDELVAYAGELVGDGEASSPSGWLDGSG
jgi:DNA-binding transcriptional LysR family regulator